MNYLYYPGCSLEGTAREYDLSTRALFEAMGVNLTEIKDWTCCGASAAPAVSHLLSLALPAVNIALAETMIDSPHILVPCSACYLNLKKVTAIIQKDPAQKQVLNEILNEKQLELQGKARIRHLLDVLVNDINMDDLREKIQKPLTGLRIAPYYGCQCLRPYAVFDDPEKPVSMERLITAAGASVFPWDMGGKCCGASHMNTCMNAGMERVAALLTAAKGADAIVTVCPMCQINLDAYQDQVSAHCGQDLHITVLYLPQLLCLALGVPEDRLGIPLNLAVTPAFRQKLTAN